MDQENRTPIKELMRRAERCLADKGYSKGTLGAYKATWNRFVYYSLSEYYDRATAGLFLKEQFGVDMNFACQKLDGRMRHALRHMNALDEYEKTGDISRRRMRRYIKHDDWGLDLHFADYLEFCQQQKYSDSWISNVRAALRLFWTAIRTSGTASVEEIGEAAIQSFTSAVCENKAWCPNVRRMRTKQVAEYLQWLHHRGYLQQDFSYLLPNIKRTPPALPQVWTEDEIQSILSVIDTANPVGKRNYAIFLLLARTGLRISDVVGLKFSHIDWKMNCISVVQNKTGQALSVPLSQEVGMAIISYLQHGRPYSNADVIFLSHNAPFQPLNAHNNFHPEMRKYMRRAGIPYNDKRHNGVHTMRASFATNMLKKGASLQNISQILGHSDLHVTGTYLRVDIDQLRICSLGLEVAK